MSGGRWLPSRRHEPSLEPSPALPDLAGHSAAGSAPQEEDQAVGYIQGHASSEPGDAGMEGHAQAAMQYYSHDSMQVPCSCLDCPLTPQDAPF